MKRVIVARNLKEIDPNLRYHGWELSRPDGTVLTGYAITPGEVCLSTDKAPSARQYAGIFVIHEATGHAVNPYQINLCAVPAFVAMLDGLLYPWGRSADTIRNWWGDLSTKDQALFHDFRRTHPVGKPKGGDNA